MREKGFTLIESLVVLGVIALLIGIAIPTLTGAIGKARNTRSVELRDVVGISARGHCFLLLSLIEAYTSAPVRPHAFKNPW